MTLDTFFLIDGKLNKMKVTGYGQDPAKTLKLASRDTALEIHLGADRKSPVFALIQGGKH